MREDDAEFVQSVLEETIDIPRKDVVELAEIEPEDHR